MNKKKSNMKILQTVMEDGTCFVVFTFLQIKY